MLNDKFIIGWRTHDRHCGRFLFMNSQGEAFLTPERLKAAKFTRTEANEVILALLNSNRWTLAGPKTFPDVESAESVILKAEAQLMVEDMKRKRR